MLVSKAVYLTVLALALAGCAQKETRRYSQEHDSAPKVDYSVDHIPDAVPKHEPRTRAGNSSPYTVRGKTYRLLDKPEGYSETGLSSWYGEKFHGERTANGEIYNMYGMTAAHKTLPIPSYVKVTNLANDRSVIVRVNDRGPFHEGRIIDLTYTAAKKLGFQKLGTAKVKVEAVGPGAEGNVATRDVKVGDQAAPAPKNSAGFALPEDVFLQVGAFGSQDSATRYRDKVAGLTSYPVKLVPLVERNIYRVWVGPFSDKQAIETLQNSLEQRSMGKSHIVMPQ